MNIVVLGLSLSSAWGNGHATTYRALLKALAGRGHDILFLERDVPWYAAHRDLPEPAFCRLRLYPDPDALDGWHDAIARADLVIVGSYVPEGVAVGRRVQQTARGVTAFYDIDTPVTLAKLERGDDEYLSAEIIPGYDLYLSFTGGPILDHLVRRYGARAARALYCSVDETAYQPVGTPQRWDLSYLGTYSPDRQPTLDRLLLEPARCAPSLRFAVAGPQYPDAIDWPGNVERLQHVLPADHPAFYAASRYTLNVTRADMIRHGHSPSVRLFEAAACGTPIISDRWPGLDTLFEPGTEIMLADTADDVLTLLHDRGGESRQQQSARARARVIGAHTARHRAIQLEGYVREGCRDEDIGIITHDPCAAVDIASGTSAPSANTAPGHTARDRRDLPDRPPRSASALAPARTKPAPPSLECRNRPSPMRPARALQLSQCDLSVVNPPIWHPVQEPTELGASLCVDPAHVAALMHCIFRPFTTPSQTFALSACPL